MLKRIFLKLLKREKFSHLETLLLHFNNNTEKVPDIVYFGDSTVERISKYDSDKRTIPEMLSDELLNNFIILSISHSAYHMTIYYHFMLVFQKTIYKPKIAIIPINMRSFSPQWDLYPPYQFEAEIKLLNDYIQTGRRYFRNKKKINKNAYFEFENLKVVFPLTPFNTIKEFKDIVNAKPNTSEEQFFRRKQIFIFHYLYNLNQDHRKLLDLIRIVDCAREMKIKIVFYFTPINYKAAISYVGEEFRVIFDRNVQKVIKILKEKGVHPYNNNLPNSMVYIDLTCSLDEKYFFHRNTLTEHLNEFGRKFVANRVSKAVPWMISID